MCIKDDLYTDIVSALGRLINIRHVVFNTPGPGYESSWDDGTSTGVYAGRGFREDMVIRLTPEIPALEPHSTAPTSSPAFECLCPLVERLDFLEHSLYSTNPHLNLRTMVPFVAAKWEMSQSHPGLVSPLKHLTLPTKDLPKTRAKRALKEWIERTGLVLEISHPYLRAARPSKQYEGLLEEEDC